VGAGVGVDSGVCVGVGAIVGDGVSMGDCAGVGVGVGSYVAVGAGVGVGIGVGSVALIEKTIAARTSARVNNTAIRVINLFIAVSF